MPSRAEVCQPDCRGRPSGRLPGSFGFACGVEDLAGHRDRFGFISQNLALCLSGRCLFHSPEPLMLDKGREKVGLFAVLDSKALAAYPKGVTEEAKLVPPELMAGSLAGQLAAEGADWIVVLDHGPLEEAERLARKVRGIHVIVVGHEQRLVAPRRVGDALIVSSGEEGNRVGVLSLFRNGQGAVRHSHRLQLFRYGTDREDPEVLERIERLRP